MYFYFLSASKIKFVRGPLFGDPCCTESGRLVSANRGHVNRCLNLCNALSCTLDLVKM